MVLTRPAARHAYEGGPLPSPDGQRDGASRIFAAIPRTMNVSMMFPAGSVMSIRFSIQSEKHCRRSVLQSGAYSGLHAIAASLFCRSGFRRLQFLE
jgi:hypothetical protein